MVVWYTNELPTEWTLFELRSVYRFRDMIANVLDGREMMTYAIGSFVIIDEQ